MLLDNGACLARLLSIDTGLLVHHAWLLLILTHHRLTHLSGLWLVRYDDLTLLLTLHSQIGSLISFGLPVASSDDTYDDDNAYHAADDGNSNPDHVDPP